jgi:hypothetical protein
MKKIILKLKTKKQKAIEKGKGRWWAGKAMWGKGPSAQQKTRPMTFVMVAGRFLGG